MIEKISILNKRREYLEGNGFTPVDTVTFLNQSITRILIEDENSGFDEREKNIEEIKRFYENTLILTRAYKSVGTNYYNDMDILKLIEERLKQGEENFYNRNIKINENSQYTFEIEIPLIIIDILIMTEGKLKEKIFNSVLETIEYFQPDSRYIGHHMENFGFSHGAWRAKAVKISFLKGLLSKNENEMILALGALSEVWEYKDDSCSLNRDGFYRDGSFLSRSIADAGGDGAEIIHSSAEIIYLISESGYEKYLKGIKNFYDIILKSFEPFFFKGAFSNIIAGKKEYDHKIGHKIINAFLLAGICAPKEYKDKILKVVKREIEKERTYKYFENEKSSFLCSKMNELLSRDDIETEEYKDQVIVCNNMDRVIKRNKDYSIGIAMHSSTVGNYECRDLKKSKYWFTGDGAYCLYDEDTEQYKDYWENVDYNYIPGTTEIKMNMENINAQRNYKTGYAERNMTGALKWHYYGTAGMDFINWNGDLTSRKSWFFVSWGVIFAESCITGKGEVYTTVANRKFKNIPVIKADGKEIKDRNIKIKTEFLEIDGRIYMFYEKTEINLSVEKRGEYYFVKVWKEYGTDPINRNFVWAIVMKNIDTKDLREKFAVTLTEDKHLLKGEKCNYVVNWRAEELTEPFCVIYRKDDNRESRMYIKNY